MPSPLAVPLVRPLAAPVTGRILSVPLPAISSIAFAGDSITHNTGMVAPGSYNWYYSAAGYACYALGKLNQRLEVKKRTDGTPHFGASGYTAQQVRTTMVPLVVTAAPSACVVHCGTNDLAAGASAATIQGRLSGIAADLLAGGVTPILTTILPRISGTGEADRLAARQSVNTWLRGNAAGLGAKLCDWESLFDVDQDGYGDAGFYYDAAAPGHPGILGSATLGGYLATWLAANFTLPADPFATLFAGTNYVNNPLLSGTDGVPSGAPTGWLLGTTGGASITSQSKVARTDGIAGEWCRVAFTGGAGAAVTASIPVTLTGLTAGDTVEALAEVRVASGTPAAVNVTFMNFYSYVGPFSRSILNGMGTATWGAGGWSASDALPSGWGTEIHRSVPYALPAGYTNQGGTMKLLIYGSGTVDIARPILRKV